MRAVSIVAVLLLLAANALALLPAASAFQSYLLGGALALGLVALAAVLAGRGPRRDSERPAEAARPPPPPARANQAEAEVVSFLATLQERGRLVDFLMDDITAHDDARVGAGSSASSRATVARSCPPASSPPRSPGCPTRTSTPSSRPCRGAPTPRR